MESVKMKKKVLIVGGVAGGSTAAARLRRLSEETEIILFEKGEFISFANCGLPYYIGGTISERENLLVQTVEGMSAQFNLDIRNFNEVLSIDPERKVVKVKDLKEDREYEESYDDLILSPGASPLRPPIPGLAESENVFTLRNIPDTDTIKSFIDENKPKTATVIGGGFIGIEMVENLVDLGIKVTLIEALDQVMAPFDFEMASILHNHLRVKGVNLILGDGVSSFQNKGRVIATNSGKNIENDMVILSIGVRPDSKLAMEAALEVGERGHIVVNEKMQTSNENIYALGDAITFKDLVYGEPMALALASPANRQARIAANIIMGYEDDFKGFLGTSVAKVFDYTAASTGWNEKRLKASNKDYKAIHLVPMNHASYYPGGEHIFLKVLFDPTNGRLLGAQGVGGEGTDKRIDVLATAISAKMTMDDLTDLELAYAPPFSSAKDPVNMAGYIAQNIMDKKTKTIDVWELDEEIEKGAVLLDVRNFEEVMLSEYEGALNIPLNELRGRLEEIPKDKKLIVTCQVGLRGYIAEQILAENNIDSTNLSGGLALYWEYKGYSKTEESVPKEEEKKSKEIIVRSDFSPTKSIDARSLQCPGPIASVYKALNDLEDGDILEVKATDPGFIRDIGAWTEKTGNKLLDLSKGDGHSLALIQKGNEDIVIKEEQDKNGATIIAFSGDFDKTMASLIIATGAASMGKKVTMFFTFWGLNVLRKHADNVEKTSTEKMFSMMMPEGVDQLKLSKMNMLGMGTSMMKNIMKDKNVDSPRQLLEQAQEMGVDLIACAMSMDLMGIKEEELIDGVEIAGVATYLAKTEEANLNLFI